MKALPRLARHPAVVLSLALVTLALTACRTSTPAPAHNAPPAPATVGARLLIIGGGLSRSNAQVYRAFLDHAESVATARQSQPSDEPPIIRIAVLPTASGVPDESASSTIESIRSHATNPEALDLRAVPISINTPDRADDPDLARWVAAAHAIWFTGGDQSRITAILRPSGRSTAVDQAINRALANGAIIAGTSAGAAMMSDPMITGGRSERWLTLLFDRQASTPGSAPRPHHANTSPTAAPEPTDPEDEDSDQSADFRIAPGMGYFTHGITDQHFLARGRLGRLVAAAIIDDRRFGVGIADNRAILVNADTGEFRALGDRAAVVIDARHAERTGSAITGLRVSLMNDGDAWRRQDGTDRLSPAQGRTPRDRVGPLPGAPAERVLEATAWSRDGVREALEVVALRPTSVAIIRGDAFEVRFTRDRQTAVHVRPDPEAPPTIHAARLDVVRRQPSPNQ